MPQSPRERLVEAAIREIERCGLARLTVRGIAAAAGMNIAAVNYHFRSKEALVAAALEMATSNTVDDSLVMLGDESASPDDRLSGLLLYFFDGARRYPHLTRALLHDAFSNDNYSGPFPRSFAPVLLRLRDAICGAVPGLPKDEAAHRATAALSSALFPAFFAGLFAPLRPLDTEAQRRTYCREMARVALLPVR